jgi:threonine synthase
MLGADAVRAIVRGAFDFPAPVVPVGEDTWILELFHGPTGSFKDFGARFLARLLPRLRRSDEGPVLILVATSGDTGGAVAEAVRGLTDVKAIVLFPRNRISDVQRRQIQTPAASGSVIPVEVQGSFDDCQRMVKEVLADPGEGISGTLTSANSVNVGRLIPQSFYYAYGWGALPTQGREDLVVSVPSGNLGNLTAGILAEAIGIPIAHFVAASNANDAMRRYLTAGRLPDGPSLETLSSAMDVARPSNLERILTVYERDIPALRAKITPTRHEDSEVLDAMGRLYRERGYLMDPHTAVGYLGLEEVRRSRAPAPGLILSTADPAKFPETVLRATGKVPPARGDWEGEGSSPEAREAVRRGEEATVRLSPDPDELRALARRAANAAA